MCCWHAELTSMSRLWCRCRDEDKFYVNTIYPTPDKVWLGSSDGIIRIYDPKSWKLLHMLSEHTGDPHASLCYLAHLTLSLNAICSCSALMLCRRYQVYHGHRHGRVEQRGGLDHHSALAC